METTSFQNCNCPGIAWFGLIFVIFDGCGICLFLECAKSGPKILLDFFKKMMKSNHSVFRDFNLKTKVKQVDALP